MDKTLFNLELSRISRFVTIIEISLYVQNYLLHNLSTFQDEPHIW